MSKENIYIVLSCSYFEILLYCNITYHILTYLNVRLNLLKYCFKKYIPIYTLLFNFMLLKSSITYTSF